MSLNRLHRERGAAIHETLLKVPVGDTRAGRTSRRRPCLHVVSLVTDED